MPDDKLRLLFRKQREDCEIRDDACPGDDHIARLVAGALAEEEAKPLKAHVADCPMCASSLADAVRLPDSRAGRPRDSAPQRGTPGLRASAAAALLAVVAITAVWQPPDGGIPPGENGELRAVRPSETVPSVIFPGEGQKVSPADMTVRWTPVAGAMHYSVRIVDDYGRLVVDSFADAPRFTVPPQARLAPGASYYVKIDAYVVGDKAVSSRHVQFTVTE